jgi:transcriptional regulator with XRE-family HTH domain
MKNGDLTALGEQIAELRISRQLKQTELAYEAGVSHRTLQRLEAGEVVKSDGLIKVISCLGRLKEVMAALGATDFSPYEMLADAGLKVSQLKKQRNAQAPVGGDGTSKPATRKRRVRHTAKSSPELGKVAESAGKKVKVQWPEDQP